MNHERIIEIISNYNELIKLVKSKVAILEELDTKYNTSRGIEDITFTTDTVNVMCDDSSMGCSDYLSFSFPIDWLSKTDLELKELIENERELEKEMRRKKEEDMRLRIEKETKERDFKEYQRLKAKFEHEKN